MSTAQPAAPKPEKKWQTPANKTLRVCWTGPADPAPGDLILSKGSMVAYSVRLVKDLHRAFLATSPRLMIIASVAPLDLVPDEHAETIVATALPWSHTAPPGKSGRNSGVAQQNAQARRKAADRTQRRAKRLMDDMRASRLMEQGRLPEAVEAVRLPPEKPQADDTPRVAGEVDAAAWSDPEDNNIHREHARTIRHYRTADVLVRMSRRPNSQITADHITAAGKVRLARDIAAVGLGGGNAYEPSVGRTATRARMDHGAAAATRYQREIELKRVIKAVGPSNQAIFRWVVLGNQDVESWVRDRTQRAEADPKIPRPDRKIELGKLIGVLNVLVDHYRLEIAMDVQMGEVA